jgi:hypothetical protein
MFKVVDLRVNKPCKMVIPINDNTYPGKNVQDSINNTNIWAPEETNILIDVLKNNKPDDGLIIDAGSNSGYFTILSMLYNYKVISIEPNNIHKNYLIKSIEENNFDINLLTYYQAFVSNHTEDVDFDGWSGYDSLINKNNTYKVPTIQLDKICDKALFLKIDVEGCEPDVLDSAKDLIKNGKIPYIMFELTYIINNKIDNKQINMLHILKNSNYTIYEIIENNIIKINDVDKRTKIWKHDYFNIHKVFNPSITNAGCNCIAVYKNYKVPSAKYKNI